MGVCDTCCESLGKLRARKADYLGWSDFWKMDSSWLWRADCGRVCVSKHCSIKWSQTRWLRTTEICSFTVWRPETEIKALAGPHFLQRFWRKSLVLACSAFCGCLLPWLVTISLGISASLFMWLSPLWSLIRMLVIGCRAHLDYPIWSHLKIPKSITSAKTVFLNKVTFTELEG